MIRLSVNINKFATLRNARGGDNPDITTAATYCERFGAQGITVHPRPDERHITYEDARSLKKIVTTEYNIEGNPIKSFMDLVLSIKPTQVTLVPDAPDALTSNAGWNTNQHKDYLKDIITELKRNDIRTSIFLDPDITMLESAAATGTDRIELYTESYAVNYKKSASIAIKPYVETAKEAVKWGLGINAGHDLDLDNLSYFTKNLPGLDEVSIGHALICDSIYRGLESTIADYLRRCES
ncbi:MAG: pyridoxine 5-phosphate synthase [Sphingobacteriales bacterium]|jgi:pyridoxine 5-phosphate synthase